MILDALLQQFFLNWPAGSGLGLFLVWALLLIAVVCAFWLDHLFEERPARTVVVFAERRDGQWGPLS